MLMLQKFRSLRRYRQTFRNWWIAAGARYLRGRLGPLRELRLRAGGRFNFVPASDFVVVGEVFVAGAYDGVAGLRGVRRVWDVGGNIGCFVLWASGQFAGAEFNSFEPCAGTPEKGDEDGQSDGGLRRGHRQDEEHEHLAGEVAEIVREHHEVGVDG